ncbi:restriction endonuclease subunit S [Symbiobacterium thermophilum]|uniref:Type I restriction modification DNA specificity domain-containing protein n=1 Tax=Symbiobacterium thermophilum TaxID=2734 RepID=A0A953I524_SYMTR|nr:restriction endonuclease subunit S [Symbiobacterium thermophilum]MBY6277755.1 hypothetical protein [Symbiobacterium thermophilum]
MTQAAEWQETTLRECAIWYSGGTPRTSEPAYWNGDIPWISSGSLKSFYIYDSDRRVTQLGLENGTRLVPQGAVIFVVRGMSLKSEFRVGIAKRPVAFGQDCKALVAKPCIHPEFLANVLRSKESEILSLVQESGHGTGTLQTDVMKALRVPLPPIEEQQRIVEFVSAFDRRIMLLQEMNNNLEAVAQALFTSWFIDFDPVRAKADGREPEGMDAEMAALFPSQFESSEVGLIPSGWRVTTLSELCDLNPESWSDKYHPELITYLDLGSVKDNKITGMAEYTYTGAPSRARRVLRTWDTIIGTVRPGNRSFAFILDAPSGMTGSTAFAVLRPRKAAFAEFVYLASTRKENIERLASLADGGAYPAVSPHLVHQTPIVCPPVQVIEAFAERVRPLFCRIAANQRYAATLSAVRDTLLPRLISGKLRVPEAEEALKEVL